MAFSPINMEIKKLALSLYATIFVIVLALVAVFWFYTRSFTTFKVLPEEASVTIDNKSYPPSAAGVVKAVLDPGMHEVKVEASGYIGKVSEINFTRGNMKSFNISLAVQPEPVTVASGGRFLAKDNNFNTGYYLGDGGTSLYKFEVTANDKTGELEISNNVQISGDNLFGIQEIVWSSTKELALFRKKNNSFSLFDFKKYDFVHQTETLYGQTIGSLAWAPDNSEIAYYYMPSNGNRQLILANLTNTETAIGTDMKAIGLENPILHWSPDSQTILVIPQSSDTTKNKVCLFNISSRSTIELTEDGNQTDAIFSPDGNKILYSTIQKDSNSSIQTVLSVMDKDGSNKHALNLRADLKKVAWSKDSKTIVAAGVDNNSSDPTIFWYNTDTDQQTGPIIRNIGNFTVKKLFLTDDEKAIIYETDEGIYALKISG
ncbi:MAG: PEGA domain-containing protein [Candidatus Berkelbacteria bacterium]|nr:PEGA domain-containing protein [Candidatus Berkelbacteria bacterium]